MQLDEVIIIFIASMFLTIIYYIVYLISIAIIIAVDK